MRCSGRHGAVGCLVVSFFFFFGASDVARVIYHSLVAYPLWHVQKLNCTVARRYALCSEAVSCELALPRKEVQTRTFWWLG